MKKKLALILLVILLALLFGGCWNYRGLDEMVIVAGIAIDKNPITGNYMFSFEIVDVSTPIKEEGPKPVIVESEGKTFFDAVRNAKKRVVSKLYFGHAQVVILSEDVARNENLNEIIDWFLRDAEVRETLCVVVSQEETAGAVLGAGGLGTAITASEVHEIIEDDHKITSSTAHIELYKIFNILHCEGQCLSLAAVHLADNDGEKVVEVNGIAVFKNGTLQGYLSPEESKYFLFVTDEIEGGLFAYSSTGGQDEDVTLEISENKTKQSYTMSEDGVLTMSVEIKTTVYLAEINEAFDALDSQRVAMLEEMAGAALEEKIMEVVGKVRNNYGADIFGFGGTIYRSNPKLWEELKGDWTKWFKAMNVEVKAQVHIANSAFLKDTVKR